MVESIPNATELRYFSGPCLKTNNSEILNSAGSISKENIFAYCIWSPIVTVTGIFGNLFSIAVLKKQFEKEQMYYFQLIIMTVEILTSFGMLLSGMAYPYLFASTVGPNWVKYNFTFAAYICYQIVINNMLVTSLLLLITMTNMDRLQVAN